MPTDPPPALIFDFGNVVAFFDYTRAAEALARPRGLDGATLLARAREAGLAGAVREFESGRISDRAFAREASAMLGIDVVEFDEFATAWADVFWLNEPVGRLVADLKARGHRLVLGSNTNPIHADHFRRLLAPTLGHFDRLVLSYQVGAYKPEAPFYHACAEAAGRPAGECVFIDDLPENVEGARAAGMEALLFTDEPNLAAALGQRGLKF